MESYRTPEAMRAAALFDTMTQHWSLGGHVRDQIRFAVKRAAGGEEGVLEQCVEHHWRKNPPGERTEVLRQLRHIVTSARRQPATDLARHKPGIVLAAAEAGGVLGGAGSRPVRGEAYRASGRCACLQL